MKTKRLILGIGVNDADYQVSRNEIVDGKRKDVWRCPYYQAWKDMLCRCYSRRCHGIQPTYSRCRVDPEWHRFSSFRAWMERQEWEGMQLDKDILVPGNKTYSPELCVFVSRNLNSFLTGRGSARGEYPIGVCWHKGIGKFQAVCSNPFSGKNEYIGLFTDAEPAHEAWRKRKHELACKYADMQTDNRVAEALRSRFSKPLSIGVD